jgi:hypothetical protein
MKVNRVELSRDFKEIVLLAIGDIHDGDKLSDGSILRERIDFVKNTPNAYLLLNGDLINNSQPGGPGKAAVYWDTPPQEQMKYMAKVLEPVADRIIGATDGNHERRLAAQGIDMTALMLQLIGVSLDRYSPDGLYTFLNFGKENSGRPDNKGGVRTVHYKIYQNHGSRSGRTAGGKLNAIYDMSHIVPADIYIHSHSHLPAALPGKAYLPDQRNYTILDLDTLYINTGSTLKYGGYGEQAEYRPLSTLTPYVYLCGTRRAMDVDFGVRRTF